VSAQPIDRIVVIGAGLAGARVCDQLRRQGYTGGLSVVGREKNLPYDRPPLSKAVLRGERDQTILNTDLAGLGVELILDESALALDLASQSVRTTRHNMHFDRLVVATGADPIRLPGEGPQLTLRTIDDALKLRHHLREGASIVIIGASWIGAEVASAALHHGCDVTCVEAGPSPVAQTMGGQVGARLAAWWHGVDLRTETAVTRIDDGTVLLADGSELHADLVVTGVGVRPATSWLADSGLDIERGVLVDEWLRAAPGVVSVGDIAARWSPRYERRVRVEHWDNAASSARVAAAALLHAPDTTRYPDGIEAYDPIPYFWSDQFGHKLQYAGQHDHDDHLTWRENPDGDGWSAVWLDAAGRFTALLAVDWPVEMASGRRALASGARPDLWRLSNPTVALTEA
jgi:NADPH-dependent 2,4-dienoyl-CoA reductase/sulfur reductase-like enzyme